MRTFSIVSAAAVLSLSACVADEAQPSAADLQASLVAGAPTLSCNLEYENLSPFQVAPAASFQVPYSQVQSVGATASDGRYRIYASVNPTPTTNLAFTVGVMNTQTGKDTVYLVLPSPQAAGAFLFETGARISALTKAGVTYDHVRAYCSYTLTP
jgi:hypothetical protein